MGCVLSDNSLLADHVGAVQDPGAGDRPGPHQGGQARAEEDGRQGQAGERLHFLHIYHSGCFALNGKTQEV